MEAGNVIAGRRWLNEYFGCQNGKRKLSHKKSAILKSDISDLNARVVNDLVMMSHKKSEILKSDISDLNARVVNDLVMTSHKKSDIFKSDIRASPLLSFNAK